MPRDEFQPKDHNEFRLVYHGAVTKRYGVDLLVIALAQIRNQIPEIKLKLIGGGEFWDELISLTKDLQLEDYVSFTPNVVLVSDLPDILRACHIGIVPNRNDCFTDGLLPTKMMEYAALGIPIIAAKTTTISAYFDSDMVSFFQPGNSEDLSAKIIESL